MDLIDEFIARYRKEFDFFDQAARLVAQTLELHLQAAGIRSIVTSRAKSLKRVEAKCRKRMPSKGYGAVEEIFSDIPDLAGARVALYFPGERNQVDNLIAAQFILTEPRRDFPGPTRDNPGGYKKRFSGYQATHYRVRLPDTALSEAQRRYAEARVEIQVASVLMHAWAEVEHDLIYKPPLTGALSEDEYAILDELNGLVLSGEIALERLQRAGETRIAGADRPFANHYDLASHILNRASALLDGPLRETALGRVDFLFQLLERLGLATPAKLAPYLDALHADTEARPVAEQIVDRLVSEDASRYRMYDEVRLLEQPFSSLAFVSSSQTAGSNERELAIGRFMTEWITFERFLRQTLPATGPRPVVPTPRTIDLLLGVSTSDRQEMDRIRRLRNELIHGVSFPHDEDIRDATESLRRINERLTDPATKTP